MTKIALISDIHGNLTAFEAVLEDISHRDVDAIYCLGDLIGKGPRGSECIALVKQHCDKVIRGNWDVFIHNEVEDDHVKWIQSQLIEEDYAYLKSLPFYIDFELNGKFVRCFHASPRSEFERIAPEYSSKEACLSLFENSKETDSELSELTPDIVFYGDIHLMWLRNYDTKTLCNIGSVGLDLVEATYVILDGSNGVNNIQFIRVPYDREAEITAAKELGMVGHEAYAEEIMYDEVMKRKSVKESLED